MKSVSIVVPVYNEGDNIEHFAAAVAEEMAKARIEQAKDTNCKTLVTACPFCKLNLENPDLEVLDLCEFLVKYGDMDG